MTTFQSLEDVKLAILGGKTVFWKNKGYKAIDSGLNDGTFLNVWNLGGWDENFAPLNFETESAENFFME